MRATLLSLQSFVSRLALSLVLALAGIASARVGLAATLALAACATAIVGGVLLSRAQRLPEASRVIAEWP